MKKVLALLVILAAIFGWSYWQKTDIEEKQVELQPATSKPDPRNATFIFEDGPVTLKNGSAETDIAPGSAIKIETDLTDNLAYGDLNQDGKTDTVVLLVQSGGGSGIFLYAAAYISGNVDYKGTNAVFVGDRITPKTISIGSDGTIKITYLDRKPDEPMAAEPTIVTSKSFVYRQGHLEER